MEVLLGGHAPSNDNCFGREIGLVYNRGTFINCVIAKISMKKIILIVGGVVLVAVLGRGIWAYQQMKADETKVGALAPTATTVSEQSILVAPTKAPAPVFASINQNKTEGDSQKKVENNKLPVEQAYEVHTIKIKLDNGEIISRNVTQPDYEKYQSALSRFPIDESSKLKVSTAFPSEGCELGKNTFGREVQVCKLASIINFSQISDIYIVNVSTDKKESVVDFTPFPLSLTIDLTTDALRIDPSKLSIYYWGGTSVCSEKNCGYYIAMPTDIDTKNKQATAMITRPGQYLLGVKK